MRLVGAQLRQAGLLRRMPSPGADCAGTTEWLGSAPQIHQPYRTTRYRLRLMADQPSVALAATTDARCGFRSQDDAFFGESTSSRVIALQPPRASHMLPRAVDEHGRSDER